MTWFYALVYGIIHRSARSLTLYQKRHFAALSVVKSEPCKAGSWNIKEGLSVLD